MFLVIIICAIEFDRSLGPGILFRVMASMVKADEKVPSGIFFLLVFQVCMNGTCHPHSVLKYDCNVQKKCHGHGVSNSNALKLVLLV